MRHSHAGVRQKERTRWPHRRVDSLKSEGPGRSPRGQRFLKNLGFTSAACVERCLAVHKINSEHNGVGAVWDDVETCQLEVSDSLTRQRQRQLLTVAMRDEEMKYAGEDEGGKGRGDAVIS